MPRLVLTIREQGYFVLTLEDRREIIITLDRVAMDKARIGIEADPKIMILRDVLHEQEKCRRFAEQAGEAQT